jgi:diguanylate cyclase (GGDEF)-like protein
LREIADLPPRADRRPDDMQTLLTARTEDEFADATAVVAPATSELAGALQHEAMMGALRAAPAVLGCGAVLSLATASALGQFGSHADARLWLALVLLLLTVRIGHVFWSRAAVAPAAPRHWVPQYLAGLALGAAAWAALPWLRFADVEPSQRVIAMLAMAGVAFAETLALRAMPRLAVAQAAVVTGSAAAWYAVSAQAIVLEPAAIALTGFGMLVALCIARGRELRATLLTELETRRLAGVEAEQAEHVARLEFELAKAGAALAAAAAEAAVREARARSGKAQHIDERTTELEKRSRDLARQAVTDPLTCLPNRKGINEHLVELLEPMSNPDHTGELALLFLDLDEFKEVNDQHGHLAGDAVLRVVAERLRESLPRAGFAARWGGDEFIVVLPGLGRIEQVRMVAEKLRAELCVPIRLEDGTLRVGCSIGIALAPYHGRTPEALIIAADHAVYAAKTEGRDRVRVFDVALAKKAQRQHQIAQALPGALERNQLEIAYQPIVSAVDGTATHVEALARWRHPHWGAVSPGEFIAVAEANGQIHAMGRWVLRQACLDAARWPGANAPKVSVNVSAMQVNSGHLVSQVREALAAAKLSPRRLVIELTESLPMARSEGVSQTLSDLRAMGVTLAIDDFGTGYSSLSSLMKQPLSLVKIDQSFVKDVPGGGEVLIKATVDVALRFGLDVVAEGVETVLQRQRLEALGVNYMQGYLFGRPMPNQEFIAWLALHDASDEPFVLRA